MAGRNSKTDPMFQLDVHLTRDFTEHLWGALDGAWYKGGKSSIDGVEGKALNNVALGFTLGYQINENLSLTFGYKSTIKDSAAGCSCKWTGSWCRSWPGGTRSSKARDG